MNARIALKMMIFMILLTGVIYPLLITFIAQLVMPEEANGSLLSSNGKIIGSRLIAQKFEKSEYFWPRPSAIDYNPIQPSGGSNLGPTSQKLKEIVAQRAQKLSKDTATIPPELVYASGSGLDPHLSIDAAYFQVDRIAKARSLSSQEREKLMEIIASAAEKKPVRHLRMEYVNVLVLNQMIDQQFAKKSL